MSLAFNNPHGFSDLADSALVAGQPASGLAIGKISDNSAFGLTRLEVFKGVYKHGDTVQLPTSPIDGYNYPRSELIYCWSVQTTGNPQTNWATNGPPWTLWYGAWSVNQATGVVSCSIGYRGNSDHSDRQLSTNDSLLDVTVFAQRGLSSISMAAIPAYVEHKAAEFVTDAALTQKIAQELNRNAKFSVVKAEAIYMGTFPNGGQVPRPTSPVDGYVYNWGEVQFVTSPFWTGDDDGLGHFQTPAISKGQLQDWNFKVDGKGLVSCQVTYQLATATAYNIGRVQVVAFCQRKKTFAGLMGVVGAWCDASGNVIQPIEVGYGGTFTCPVGATKLQLGINDDALADDTGTAWTYVVNQTGSTSSSATPSVGPTIPPWVFTGGINSAFPYGLTGGGSPVVVALTFVAGDVATITWTGGGPQKFSAVSQNQTTPDGTNNVGTFQTGTSATAGTNGTGFPTRWTGIPLPAANPTPAFSEQDSAIYMPGSTLRASSMLQLNKNVNDAIMTPEVFVSSAVNGTTLAAPVSMTDGYVYSYGEVTFIWDWFNTGNPADFSPTDRLVLASASINPATGAVSINMYRLQSGASNWDLQHNGTMKVWMFCRRNVTAATVVAPVVVASNGSADDSSGAITVNGV
jgi:hypothetical protein